MTETEKKKIRFQIAQIERTKPCFVWIEREETLSETEKKVYAKVKGFKVVANVKNGRVEKIFAVF